MTAQPSVSILILDDSKGEKCQGRCGLDWSSAEVLAQAKKLLHQAYGEEVQLEYFDLSDPEALCQHPEVVKRVEAEKLALPLLVLNGKVRLSGYFDFRMLKDAVQAEKEMGYA